MKSFFLEVIFFIHKNNKIKMKLILHETLFCTSKSIISNIKQVSITKIKNSYLEISKMTKKCFVPDNMTN